MKRDTINIRLKNNTGVRIPVQILGGDASSDQNSDLNTIVSWDLTNELYLSNIVILTTIPEGQEPLLDKSIDGVVNALNKMKIATFFRIGFIVYAIALLNSSCSTADIIISDDAFNIGTASDGALFSIKEQTDGKILIAGFFSDFNGTSSFNILRLNSDGSVDSSFIIGTGANLAVEEIAIQSDGKILLGGVFTDFNGTAINRIVRLNTNGSVDGTFIIGSGANAGVQKIVIQTDGKILLGGLFTDFNGTATNRIVRLNTNGSVDGTFAIGTGADGAIIAIAQQTDGKILIGGSFTDFDGTSLNNIARLSSTGSVDGTFVIGTGANSGVNVIELQTDGKILIGGAFTDFNGTAINRIARLSTTGSVDGAFVIGTGADGVISTIELLTDGKILIGGFFTDFNGTTLNRIARLSSSGSIDSSFITGSGFNSSVASIIIQPNNKILAVGLFISYNGITANRLIRLDANGLSDTL